MKEHFKITLPANWHELTDGQLYYIYNLLNNNLSAAQIKTYCLFSWGHIKIVCKYNNGYIVRSGNCDYKISIGSVANAIHSLDWLDTPPSMPVRLAKIRNAEALPADFQNVEFEKFLFLDNLYQGFLETQQMSMLMQMGEILYSKDDIKLNQAEKTSIIYWWATLKSYLSVQFNSFFQPVDNQDLMDGGANIGKLLQDAMNSQIRALTKGDITKEKEVLAMDTWRALAELNAQAKEFNEMKMKYDNK